MSQPEPDTLILNAFMLTMKQSIKEKKINVENPLVIITKAMEMLEKVKGLTGKEKQMYIVRTIETIAKGEDGVFGTTDDLLPERTVKALQMFVEQDMIGDTIQLVTDATNGKFDINKARGLVTNIIAMFSMCFRKS